MTLNRYHIKHYSQVIQNKVSRDGLLIFEQSGGPSVDFFDAAYRHLNISYPKFHKMDSLCKLGFLTTEVLLKDVTLAENPGAYRTGVILSNKSSSLDTDLKYINTIKNGLASPAVFVYTLPNIVIGEICIRNGIKGENMFFVSDKYDIHSQVNYVNSLLDTGVSDACICGWVELINETYHSFLYLVARSEDESQLLHTIDNVERLYNQTPD